MSIFQQNPPERKNRDAMDILRTGSRGKAGGIVLSPGMHGTLIHFHGRSVPCTQKIDCPICLKNNIARWTAYLPVWLPSWTKPQLLELPTAAAEQVADWITKNGNMHGQMINATRPKGRANSRIKVDIRRYETADLKLPTVPDVRRALCIIWHLDYENLEDSLKEKMADFDRYAQQQEKKNGDIASTNL